MSCIATFNPFCMGHLLQKKQISICEQQQQKASEENNKCFRPILHLFHSLQIYQTCILFSNNFNYYTWLCIAGVANHSPWNIKYIYMVQHFHTALVLNYTGSLYVKIIHFLNYYFRILFNDKNYQKKEYCSKILDPYPWEFWTVYT